MECHKICLNHTIFWDSKHKKTNEREWKGKIFEKQNVSSVKAVRQHVDEKEKNWWLNLYYWDLG